MDKTQIIVIFSLLLIGIIYRLILSSNGNFIFNMDNSRDMVDVREMIVFKNLRLIGPTSAIDGFYNGPAWYYLLLIPFIISGGDPYASILMEIILWTFGGFFLLKLVSRWGIMSMAIVGCIWIASNFVLLASQYAFNPNPVIFLTPVLIYLLERYLQKNELLVSIFLWLLAGFFLHFEMAAGIFIAPVILVAIYLTNRKLLKQKNFWIGFLFYLITLLPQILFEIKHGFMMTKSVMNYLIKISGSGQIFNPLERLRIISLSFYDTILPTFMNFKLFTQAMIILFFAGLFLQLKKGIKKMDILFFLSALMIIIPLLGFVILPISINRWHLDVVVAAFVLVTGFTLKELLNWGKLGKLGGLGIFISVVVYSLLNVKNYLNDLKLPNMDPANFQNEVASIDYVFKKAEGKNFKVYTYLPSVYDYPYQYLFWWHGLRKYGYTPEEYSYAPNKPVYISGKEKLNTGNNPESSGLIFLIKQPDQNGIRHLWENEFRKFPLIQTEKVGPNEIEIRKDSQP